MTRPPRTAIVGLGAQGRVLLKHALDDSVALDVVCGVTVDAAEATAVSEQHGIPVFDSYERALAEDVEAVILATPPSLHAEQVRRAARAGKHVFCEKPFALRFAPALDAVAACRDAGVLLAVGFNQRFLPAMQRLADIVSSAALGTILHAEGNFSHNWRRTYCPEEWRVTPEESPAKARGLTGNGIHTIDALVALAGPMHRVFAIGANRAMPIDLHDVAAVTIHFADGMTGSITSIMGTPFISRIQIYGTRGWAEVRDFHTLTVRTDDGIASTTTFPDGPTERSELHAFADAVRGAAAFPIREAEVLRGVAAFEAMVTSIERGAAVAVEPVAP